MRKRIFIWPILIFSCAFLIFAQESAGTLTVAEQENIGKFLADANGMSLYLFTKDEAGVSNCYDQCAENWPPLLVDGEATAGKGVAPTLLGTTERSDGSMQITYNGIPLYYFAKDSSAGDITGQGVGDVWYLVSPYGVAIKPKVDEAAPASTADDASSSTSSEPMEVMGLSNLQADGKIVYESKCVTCHKAAGEGAEGPKLAGNSKLSDASRMSRQIINGGHFMPPFGSVLSDHEVAAVLTYIRTSWGNEFGAVTEEEVSAER